MSMFTICSAYISQGKLDETLEQIRDQEKLFTAEIGVLFRRFFQCVAQPHVIWTITEWQTEKHHNDAAQSLMKTRRDDRIASISFGPDPYFEIFCKEDEELSIGQFLDNLGFIVIAHGLVTTKAAESFRLLRKNRVAELADKLDWLRVYHNTHNSDEFTTFMGFTDEAAFQQVRMVGDLCLEEYVFTGLEKPFDMSCLAAYNQFICTPLLLEAKQSD